MATGSQHSLKLPVQMYPFENILYKVQLSGREIVSYLEESYKIFDANRGLVGSPQNFEVVEKYSDVRTQLFNFFKSGKSFKKLEEN